MSARIQDSEKYCASDFTSCIHGNDTEDKFTKSSKIRHSL